MQRRYNPGTYARNSQIEPVYLRDIINKRNTEGRLSKRFDLSCTTEPLELSVIFPGKNGPKVVDYCRTRREFQSRISNMVNGSRDFGGIPRKCRRWLKKIGMWNLHSNDFENCKSRIKAHALLGHRGDSLWMADCFRPQIPRHLKNFGAVECNERLCRKVDGAAREIWFPRRESITRASSYTRRVDDACTNLSMQESRLT